MRNYVVITALLAAAPVWAQSNNPLDRAQPNTIILDENWQMTPSDVDCMLVHRDQNNRPDLLVASRRDADSAVFGLLLSPSAPYATALRLKIVAQTSVSQQIGEVTFTPHRDRGATLLMARWPTTNLLSRLATASRLSFYGPGQRQVASVATTGGAAAAAMFRQCLGAKSLP